MSCKMLFKDNKVKWVKHHNILDYFKILSRQWSWKKICYHSDFVTEPTRQLIWILIWLRHWAVCLLHRFFQLYFLAVFANFPQNVCKLCSDAFFACRMRDRVANCGTIHLVMDGWCHQGPWSINQNTTTQTWKRRHLRTHTHSYSQTQIHPAHAHMHIQTRCKVPVEDSF